jgi:hypothetical protein
MNTTRTRSVTLPDLRFVAIAALLPHEQHDQQRSLPLMEKLREQGVLKNPPIVTPLPSDPERFVVLDGANRVTAAGAAGLPHLVVQVVSYEDPQIRLSTWHHALIGFSFDELRAALDDVPGLRRAEADVRHARAVLARREAIAFVSHAPDVAVTLDAPGDLHERNALLNAVVDAYRTRSRFLRVTTDAFAEARAIDPEVTALVVFPHFEPAEVLELATSGARLPAGITRHLVPRRALRVNVPLDRLADRDRSLEEKNAWLGEWLSEKLAQRQVRVYEESTVLFDE